MNRSAESSFDYYFGATVALVIMALFPAVHPWPMVGFCVIWGLIEVPWKSRRRSA